jgi:light-regulated signal transduction histidine kinase (bacteriophytochrome)
MAAKPTIVSLDETAQHALLTLQARYKLATASDVLRFALQTCDLSPAQRTNSTHAQELKELRRANIKLQQFADRALRDLQEPLFVVAAALELLSSHVQQTQDVKAKKFLSHAAKGVRQLRTVMKQLRASSRVDHRGSR